eukprot:655397_1
MNLISIACILCIACTLKVMSLGPDPIFSNFTCQHDAQSKTITITSNVQFPNNTTGIKCYWYHQKTSATKLQWKRLNANKISSLPQINDTISIPNPQEDGRLTIQCIGYTRIYSRERGARRSRERGARRSRERGARRSRQRQEYRAITDPAVTFTRTHINASNHSALSRSHSDITSGNISLPDTASSYSPLTPHRNGSRVRIETNESNDDQLLSQQNSSRRVFEFTSPKALRSSMQSGELQTILVSVVLLGLIAFMFIGLIVVASNSVATIKSNRKQMQTNVNKVTTLKPITERYCIGPEGGLTNTQVFRLDTFPAKDVTTLMERVV